MVPARDPRLAVDHPGLHLLQLATVRLAGLALDLAAYVMLRYAISHETARSTPRGGDPVRAGDPHERAAAS